MCPVTLSALGAGLASSLGAGAAAGGAAAAVGSAAVVGGAGAAAGAGLATGAAALSTAQIVSLGITLAGGAFGVISSVQQANAQSRALKTAAKDKEEAARVALDEGKRQSNIRREAGRRTQSEQAARMAANGVDVNAGSALDLLDETLITTEEDAFSIRSNSQTEAQGLFRGAANDRTNAGAAKQEGLFKGIGTVLTTGSTLSSQWQNFRAV